MNNITKFLILVVVVFIGAYAFTEVTGALKPDCDICGGSGKCIVCKGQGYFNFNGIVSVCIYCNGTTLCSVCQADRYKEGTLPAIKPMPANNFPANQPIVPPVSNPFDTNDSNNSPSQSVPNLCQSCGGSGSCKICGGTGRYSNYGFTTGCKSCDDYGTSVCEDGTAYGNGKCSFCHGSGFAN